jgi:SAM-dependent methyltransferase
MKLFELGTVETTPAATDALAAAGVDPAHLLQRHQAGDWGDVEERDRQENEFALRYPQAVYALGSLYSLREDTQILIVTAPDRSCTRVMLPEEEQVLEVSAREGYAVWAAGYDTDHNPLIAAEDPLVDAIFDRLPLASALDVATGTGRYALRLARRGVAVAALDQSTAMLAVARERARAEELSIAFHEGVIGEPLPFAADTFDLVINALALCHVPDINGAVAEFARVARPGGHLLITDFHPDVVAEGWRTVYALPGTVYLLPNISHTRAGYLNAVEEAGCRILEVIDIRVRDCLEGYFSPDMLAAAGDKNFGLILLAQKPEVGPEA